VKLSDDVGPTFSGPGSPGPRRRWGRKKTLAAALALTAATGVAGLTQATGASAAVVDQVGVFVKAADANSWSAGWQKALDACSLNDSTTKSVEFVYSIPAGDDAIQYWNCRDTP
jgi:hypothetical protein